VCVCVCVCVCVYVSVCGGVGGGDAVDIEHVETLYLHKNKNGGHRKLSY